MYECQGGAQSWVSPKTLPSVGVPSTVCCGRQDECGTPWSGDVI